MKQEEAKQGQTFKGFIPPTSNYFRMPNEWIDICAEINNLAELKVIQYILRHTWGWREYDGKPKPITIDEFMHGRKHRDGKSRMDKGTGLSEMSVRNGLEKAVEHGYVLCESDERDKARIKKSYALNMFKSEVQDLDPNADKPEVQDLGDEVQDLDLQTQNLDLDTKKIRPRSEKETSKRHLQKNTGERKNDAAQQKPSSTPETPIHSSTQSSSQEIVLTEEEQQIIEFAKKDLFKAKTPVISEKLKGECAELARHIKTQEQFDDLLKRVKEKFKAPYHIKNMVNELNDWLQAQEDKPLLVGQLTTRSLWEHEKSVKVVNVDSGADITDHDIAAKVREYSYIFNEDQRVSRNVKQAEQIKQEFGVSNEDLYDDIINAYRYCSAKNKKSMSNFFEELQRILANRCQHLLAN